MQDGQFLGDTVSELRVPAFCPICGVVMRGSKSTASYYDWGCCSICKIEFVEQREDRWKEGWRPDQKQVARMLSKYSGTDD